MVKLQTICPEDFDDLRKGGGVRVDYQEMKELFKLLKQYIDVISEKDIETLNFIFNKYVILPNLGNKQKEWYSILQKFKSPEFVGDASAEDVDETRQAIWDNYMAAKITREKLATEIEKRK